MQSAASRLSCPLKRILLMAGVPAFSSVVGVTECGALASLEPIRMLNIATVKQTRSSGTCFPAYRSTWIPT